MQKSRQRRRSDKILLCALAFLLAGGFLALSCFPSPRFSATENRNLTDFPSLTVSGLTDGSYTATLDTYATERFPARLALRRLRALCQLAEGKCEVGGVLLCRDGSLARRMTVSDRAYAQNLAAIAKIEAFAKKHALPFSVAVAPRRIDRRTEVLPALYDTNENTPPWEKLQTALPSALTFPTLTADAHWYRTDHHWSSAGAYEAYQQLSVALGFAPYRESDFAIETVSTDFYGTSHSAAGIPLIPADSIQLYRYEGDCDFTVHLDGKQTPFEGFYDFERLLTKDQYAVFFGGNHGTVEIKGGTDRETLLVIKDSFANAVLPFLARHYDVIAVDPRYTSEPLQGFVESADRILLLCGMQTLCETPLLRNLSASVSSG